MSIEVLDPISAAGLASQALSQSLQALKAVVAQATAAGDSAAAVAASQAAVQALVAGLGIPHRWTGTTLQIRLPDGSYGAPVDLEGAKGDPGGTPTFRVGQVTTGTPSATITALDPLNPIVDFVFAPGRNGADGMDGTDGVDGWTPVLAAVIDGARRVLQVVGWTGGTGTGPAAGLYVGATGLTASLAGAIDVRGAPGANGDGSGTVIPQGTVTRGHAAAFADDTGDNIRDGGPIHSTAGTVTGGHQAVFADATGSVLQDGGAPLSTSGPAAAGHLAAYADASGTVLQDGGAITPYGQGLIAAATAAAAKALLAIAAGDVTGAEATANRGQANGYASLDAGGKLPSTQLPAIATGSMNYQGTWNASANSPTLASGTGTKGVFYKVAVPGSTTLDGISQWFLGDVVAFDGVTWDRIDGGATSVHTVANLVGDITAAALKAALAITTGDVSGLYGYASRGDVNTAIQPGDLTVATSAAFTVPRTWPLPLASSVPAGRPLRIIDAAGAISTATPLTLAASGSDRLNGATAATFASAFCEVVLVSDGASNWTYDVQAMARGGTGAGSQSGAFANVVAPGGPMTGALDFAAAVTVASAATTDIGNQASNVIDVSGTTSITSLGTRAAGAVRFVRFTGALTLAYNAASLILPTAADITTKAGDTALFRSLGSGKWVCLAYLRSDGTPLSSTAVFTGVSIRSANYTVTAADRGTEFILTGTGFALTLPSASAVGAGFSIQVNKRDGAGSWSITPPSGTIEGRASIKIYQESYSIFTDGTNWYTSGRQRGWISLGSQANLSGTASVAYTAGTGDPELQTIEFDFRSGNSGYVSFNVNSPQGLNFYYETLASQTNTSASSASSGTQSPVISYPNGGSGTVSGRLTLFGPFDGSAPLQFFAETTSTTISNFIVGGYGPANGNSVTQIVLNYSNAWGVNAVITQRAFRA